jgi:hypothetical protein
MDGSIILCHLIIIKILEFFSQLKHFLIGPDIKKDAYLIIYYFHLKEFTKTFMYLPKLFFFREVFALKYENSINYSFNIFTNFT